MPMPSRLTTPRRRWPRRNRNPRRATAKGAAVQEIVNTAPGSEPSPPMRDGQDEIDASKAPLLEHLVELRQRLIYSLLALGIGIRRLLRLRQADLQHSGVALSMGARRRAEDRDDLHGAARVLLHADEAGAVRRRLPVVPGDRRRRSTSSSRRASTRTSGRLSCPISWRRRCCSSPAPASSISSSCRSR